MPLKLSLRPPVRLPQLQLLPCTWLMWSGTGACACVLGKPVSCAVHYIAKGTIRLLWLGTVYRARIHIFLVWRKIASFLFGSFFVVARKPNCYPYDKDDGKKNTHKKKQSDANKSHECNSHDTAINCSMVNRFIGQSSQRTHRTTTTTTSRKQNYVGACGC